MSEALVLSSAYEVLPDPYTIPLDALDVSDARLSQLDLWRPYFKRLRDEAPVHFHKASLYGPFWSVTRYKDVMEVEANHDDFSSREGIFIADERADMKLETFLHLPPPEHTKQRMAVQPVVSTKNLASMEALLRQRVATILDDLPVGETFNWVPRVSMEVTLQMLATLLDFPLEERHKLAYWTELASGGEELTGNSDVSVEQRLNGFQECASYFMQMWHQRAAEIAAGVRSPESIDLLTKLISSDATKDIINRPQEFIGNILLLVVGGNDTTRNSMSSSVLAMNQFPDEWRKLQEYPALVKSMAPEVIRWQTPFAYMRRTAVKDVDLGGKTIRKGDKVVMWYLSANRDETVIEDPESFIIDRPNPHNHLAFGYGIHRCMGNRLAELQIRILWEEILKRFERIDVVGEPVRAKNNIVREISRLPVKVIPRAGYTKVAA